MPKKDRKSHPQPNREFDKTHLPLDLAEERGLIHRDFHGHALRWSHCVRELHRSAAYKTARILDIGCGRDFPLARLIYSNKMQPEAYLGVDMNKLKTPEMLEGKKWFKFLEQTNAAILTAEQIGFKPNFIVSYECLEHMQPKWTRLLLQNIRNIVDLNGSIFISTPCFNGLAAFNHPSEITFNALGSLFEDLDFNIDAKFGIFASIRDYKEQLIKDGYEDLFNKLHECHDTNILSVCFAPIYPHLSRNCMWRLSPGNRIRLFPPLREVNGPWTSSPNWKQLVGKK